MSTDSNRLTRARERWDAARALLSAQRSGPELERQAHLEPAPASFGQQRLWFLECFEPNRAVHNLPLELRLSGVVDVAALTWSLAEVVRRHEALRTTLVMSEHGQLTQRIHPPAPVPLPFDDVSSLEASVRDCALEQSASLEAHQPFDLRRGPLLRARLTRLGEREHRLLLTLHHLGFDGWSYSVLLRELDALYSAATRGLPSPLPPVEVQYADYAVWQSARPQEDDQLAWWRQALQGAPSELELPADHPRRADQPRRGARLRLELPLEFTLAWERLSAANGVTLFTSLLAAFQTLLLRYTGCEHPIVTSPVANRAHPKLEGMIGLLMNTVALHTDLSGEPSFTELLARTHSTVLGALAHQELPFERLVAALAPERTGKPRQLTSVSFVFQNLPRAEWHLPGLEVTATSLGSGDADLDLTLFMQRRSTGLSAIFDYDATRFDAATMERLVENFQTLLDGIVAHPERSIAQLPIIAPRQLEQIHGFAEGNWESLPDDGLWRAFERAVAKDPNSLAVVSDREQVTRAELRERARGLSAVLRMHQGPGPLRVGIFLDRSVEFVVTVLATLEAGGTYVPLDTLAPVLRNQDMLRRTEVQVLVTSPALRNEALRLEVPLVSCDETAAPTTEHVPPGPDDLVYVMFTSGTTGRPRGVAVNHRSVLRLACQRAPLDIGPDDVVLLNSPLAFDTSTLELWGALLGGGLLAIPPSHLMSMRDLADCIRRRGVTFMWLTTGLFEQFVEAELGVLPLTRLLAGGDVVSPQHTQRFMRQSPGCQLVNAYGPTENTTFSTCYSAPRSDHVRERLPIGKPLTNSTVYVLDDRLQLVPLGVEGEACVGGDGVAVGYFGDPEATAERFIPNPFGPGRLYRTGDRVRMLPDGNLDFYGRRDDQVKIRDFRIELGEVEAALRACPGVRHAAAVARKKQLVAYVVSDKPLDPAELRASLLTRLPEPWVPQIFVPIDHLPLTLNGKVDRKSLPPPPEGVHRTSQPPRGEREQQLSALVQELLGVPGVGRDDDFFRLGGDSLLAVALVAQIERTFDRVVPLSAVFATPTIAGLAQAVEEAPPSAPPVGSSSLVRLHHGASEQPLFMIPGGHGGRLELALYAKLAKALRRRRTMYGFLARGVEGDEEPHQSVEEMASAYLTDVLSLQPEGPYHLVGECVGGLIAYEMAQQLVARGHRVATLLLMDTWCPSPMGSLYYRAFKRPTSLVQGFASTLARNLRETTSPLQWLSRTRGDLRDARGERAAHRYVETSLRYEPRPYPGAVTFFTTEQSERDGLSEPWHALARGGLKTHVVPGDHESYVRDGLGVTASHFAAALESVS